MRPATDMVIGPLAPADVPGLCERLRVRARNAAGERRGSVGVTGSVFTCDVGALGADLVAVDALSRLQLTARRADCEIRLVDASRELRALLDFCGLREALPCED
ncbi:MAG TPA: hypothetical protein VLJ42_02735 [Solirubrobacteraceae bacterium]|nr:hypothetical protein [Solirubrobacteraceae bacterium]